ELAVQEALSLAREAGLSSGLLAQLHVTLAYSLRGQDRFEEALATAERALAEVQADEMVQVELLEICDEACESLGMKERALEFAARGLEVRRRLRVGSPTLWWELQIFAQRLLDGGKPEEALRLAHEIIALLSSTNEG